ncbi:MAG: TrbI/VirB10 family protein, partial [Terriglobus roseus]|nr:TrbI/VirB10 family protein [Terriglobus roseus]
MSKLPLAAVLLAATPIFAQQTGVSNPPDTPVEDSAPAPDAAQVPVVRAPVLVVPTAQSSMPATATTLAGSDSPSVTLQRHDLTKFDPDGRVVGDDVVINPNAIAAGTMLRAKLETTIRTDSTQPGTPFRAQIVEPLVHEGRVVVPAGSVLEGSVTEIRGGRRLHGPALIHLQAQSIVLPDGSRMPLHASVI